MGTIQGDRIHALDAVRGFALMLGVFFHAGLSFYPGDPVWIVMDQARSQPLAITGFISHMFRMGLFYLLAGYFARLFYHRHGFVTFIKSRLKRIALPLIIFWPIIITFLTMIIIWSVTKQYGIAIEDLPPSPPLTWQTFPLTHLWFLYVLLIFYGATLLIRLPFVLIDSQGKWRGKIDRLFSAILSTPIMPLVLAVPTSIALWGHREWIEWFGIPTPDTGLIPNRAALIIYAMAFCVGWMLNRQRSYLQIIQKFWLPNILFAGVLTLSCLWMLGALPVTVPVLEGRQKLIYTLSYALAIWCWTFGLLGAGMLVFKKENRAVRYLSESSYWLYIIHLPLIMALQVWISDNPWNGELKYLVILCISLPLMLASYQLLVRNSLIGWLLNGKRYKHRRQESTQTSNQHPHKVSV